ncbi:Aspercryptin biosynthesis cluster-specific transcription regulator like protein [Verticillium longisporum]|nr:Aspercryptin biosynthesis cluster-specific transcription regulator like protein [Verticillium longisporum]
MDNQDQRSNRGRLMASVLLACFDSFVGDHKQAIVQIQNVLRHGISLPAALLEKMLRFTETLFSYSQASGANNPMGILPKSLQQYGLSFKGQLDAWAVAFEPILQSRTAPSVTHQEKAGIAVLKMFHIMSQILYLMTFSDNESQFDMFQAQFKTIVDLALEVHRQAYRPDIFGGREYTTHHIKPSFSADLGIVPPLFVVATKCRNAVTRRQAIQLLRSSARREGMWDSELTARIGHWVTAIEEEPDVLAAANGWGVPQPSVPTRHGSLEFGADVPLGPGGNARWDTPQSHRHNSSPGLSRATPGPVPEDKRVMVRAVDFDLRARFARLQVGTRGIVPGAPDMRSRVTQIHW